MLRLGRSSAEALAGAIEDGFAPTERAAGPTLAPLLDLSQRHPQRTMLLAHCLWLATQPGEVTGEAEWLTAVDAARRRTLREHETRWESLTPNQQRALRGLVTYGSPYRRAAEEALDLARGNASAGVRQLERLTVLERDGDTPRVVDPLLRDWAERRFGG